MIAVEEKLSAQNQQPDPEREAQRPARNVRAQQRSANGSGHAAHAGELLARLPFDRSSEIHVVSVVDMEVSTLPEKYYPFGETATILTELRKYNVEMAEKAVSKEAEKLRGRFATVREHIVFGIPESEILAASEEIQADLIVMGSKGVRGIAGAILGSASQRVVKHAGCGVLIAKMPETKSEA